MLHRFLLVHEMDKVKVAASIARSSGRVLAFTNTKRVADRLASSLNDDGVKAAAIHGDLRQSPREDALQKSTAGKLQVMVAPEVTARGLHIDEIHAPLHYDPTTNPKTYLPPPAHTPTPGPKT